MKKKTTILAAISGLMMMPVLGDVTPSLVSPWDVSDGQWLTISGKVTWAGVNTFKLDYGKGAVTVEMDDYDRSLEGFHLVKDDRVVVTGRVDADKDQERSIEAASVYVKNIDKSFFANSDDEEEVIEKLRAVTNDGTGTLVTGRIVFVLGTHMTIDTGFQFFEVNTVTLSEEAFDKEGEIQLEKGDRVTVYGAITDGFTEQSEVMAASLVKH